MHKIVVLSATLIIAGCYGLGGTISEETAKKYPNIETFTYNFFGITAPPSYKARTEDGVILKADFTHVNNTYLKQPKNNLEIFCKSSNGQLRMDSAGGESALKQLGFKIKDPKLVGSSTYRALASGRQEPQSSEDEHMNALIASNLATESYKQQMQTNKFLNPIADQIIFLRSNEFIGEYSCISNEKIAWRAKIEPVKIYASPRQFTGEERVMDILLQHL